MFSEWSLDAGVERLWTAFRPAVDAERQHRIRPAATPSSTMTNITSVANAGSDRRSSRFRRRR
jgi:hypothetical protein